MSACLMWEHQPALRRQDPEGSFLTSALNWWSQGGTSSWIHCFVDVNHDILQNEIACLQAWEKVSLSFLVTLLSSVLMPCAGKPQAGHWWSLTSALRKICRNHLPWHTGCTPSDTAQYAVPAGFPISSPTGSSNDSVFLNSLSLFPSSHFLSASDLVLSEAEVLLAI